MYPGMYCTTYSVLCEPLRAARPVRLEDALLPCMKLFGPLPRGVRFCRGELLSHQLTEDVPQAFALRLRVESEAVQGDAAPYPRPYPG